MIVWPRENHDYLQAIGLSSANSNTNRFMQIIPNIGLSLAKAGRFHSISDIFSENTSVYSSDVNLGGG